MKYNKIAKLIKRAKRLTVLEATSCQWISDGNAAYPMFDMPPLDKGNLCDILGIPSDKRGYIQYDETYISTTDYNFDDADDSEQPANLGGVLIVQGASNMMPVYTQAGMMLLDTDCIAPVADAEWGLWERRTAAGESYIAVKRGMVLTAIISLSEVTPYLVDTLTSMANAAKVALSKIHDDDDDAQLSLPADEDTQEEQE